VIGEEDEMSIYAKGITANVCPIFSISNVTGEGTD
jgi:GTPase